MTVRELIEKLNKVAEINPEAEVSIDAVCDGSCMTCDDIDFDDFLAGDKEDVYIVAKHSL